MSSLERNERHVIYRTAMEGAGSYSLASWPSDEIDNVSNADLRCALQLADIVQTLGIIEPPVYGGPPGNVRVVSSHYRRIDQASSVYTSFPDDVMVRLKKWLNEDN